MEQDRLRDTAQNDMTLRPLLFPEVHYRYVLRFLERSQPV